MALLDDLKIFEMDSDTDVSPEKIRDRYYELIRKYPPEQYPDKFIPIQQAYDRLKDPKVTFQQLFASYDISCEATETSNELSENEKIFRFPLDKLLLLGK